MKYFFLYVLLSFLVFQTNNAQAQNTGRKVDTVYYLLDTAALSIKDRMFRFEQESHYKLYLLQCKCYPYGKDIPFFYDLDRPYIKSISKTNFRKIKTVSIIGLIDVVLNSLQRKTRINYIFAFIEPNGANMKLTYMGLASPYDPRKVN